MKYAYIIEKDYQLEELLSCRDETFNETLFEYIKNMAFRHTPEKDFKVLLERMNHVYDNHILICDTPIEESEKESFAETLKKIHSH